MKTPLKNKTLSAYELLFTHAIHEHMLNAHKHNTSAHTNLPLKCTIHLININF